MMRMQDVFAKLRRANRKNATLYLICNFVAMMLITAFAAMMFSPTVLTILPEGGDSRKQVYAIFALACAGSVIFTIYAASLFFRTKSRELGLFVALGTSRKQLQRALLSEVLLLGGLSSLAGAAAGIPFAWLIWRVFRLFVVDSAEMLLTFDFRCLFVSALFLLVILAAALLLAICYLRRTNIMEVIQEAHRNEPVRDVKAWFGPVGIILLLFGAISGYYAGSVWCNVFEVIYPPAWLNAFYLFVLIGLYMILLHTVVRGWHRTRRNPYHGLVARSMMKFQGRQTVNNMLVVTVLIAGGCFGIFYIPIMGTSMTVSSSTAPYDYAMHYPLDQTRVPDQTEILELADSYGLQLADWKETVFLNLAVDGEKAIEGEDNKYHYEYRQLLGEGRFFSESAFTQMTGVAADVPSGTFYAILDTDEVSAFRTPTSFHLLTNMVTGQTLPVEFGGYLHYDLLSGKQMYVLDDADYAAISQGINSTWSERLIFFNVSGTDNYAFANTLFYTLVGSMDDTCAIGDYYDRVEKIWCDTHGEVYWADTDEMTKLSLDHPDSSDFRLYWAFMPDFRILDQNDFLRTMAVFLMMFLFIAIICLMSALIICYTRCITIALNNRYVFEDLQRLGASPAYLRREIRSQASRVFAVPAIVGMSAMYLLYCMIMFANDGKLVGTELLGLGMCFGVLALIALLIFTVYRYTLRQMRLKLGISR